MDKFILSVTDRLNKEVKALQYVGENWGQLDYWNTSETKPNKYPVKFPCALIDIESVTYSNGTKGLQLAEIRAVVRFFSLRLSNNSNGAPESQKAQNNAVWLVMQDINAALHGWKPATNYGKMQRVQLTNVNREDGVREFNLSYKVTFTDETATRKNKTVCVNQIEVRV